MIPIGHGAAAGFQDGRLMVVTGSLFAQIERERLEGPTYVIAIALARLTRHNVAVSHCREHGAWREDFAITHCSERSPDELASGIPAGWITR